MDAQGLAERQQALRDMLRQQQRNLPGAETEEGQAARRSLGDAGDAMNRAEEDLREGDLPGAMENQSQALDALREGMRELGRALAQQRDDQGEPQGRPGSDTANRGAIGGQEDPLGRQAEPRGDSLSGATTQALRDEELRQRSQELMDEIQRRGAELDRPREERDYLERLIDPF